ncbi:hypothetical protein FRB94_012799 [Tulasnella sp. JGI-2019a]|nr:hypothetical protein FRB94_012799 [Tulasnella sp. JGI-2019a]KAG9018513.1 hypothetical protein FRB93_000216 [Tulasnella sp. JGI-2019a]KAG9037502.1 hypothetical protein FRB95_005441 [Tulasnella sp. JGI-2019a]
MIPHLISKMPPPESAPRLRYSGVQAGSAVRMFPQVPGVNDPITTYLGAAICAAIVLLALVSAARMVQRCRKIISRREIHSRGLDLDAIPAYQETTEIAHERRIRDSRRGIGAVVDGMRDMEGLRQFLSEGHGGPQS